MASLPHSESDVAVITGAASGIGLETCRQCLAKGMTVVALDLVPIAALEPSESLLTLQVDITDRPALDNTAAKIFSITSQIAYLFHNAGIAAGESVEKTHPNDWDWVIDTNLTGTNNVLQAFLPYLGEQDLPCHIISTISDSVFLPNHAIAPYHASKAGVVALCEMLYYELAKNHPHISLSVFCPGPIDTALADSDRLRPDRYMKQGQNTESIERYQALYQLEQAILKKGLSPSAAVEALFRGVEEQRFYIFTDERLHSHMRDRFDAILAGTLPPKLPG